VPAEPEPATGNLLLNIQEAEQIMMEVIGWVCVILTVLAYMGQSLVYLKQCAEALRKIALVVDARASRE
jgi:hypothetical protein